MIRRLLLARAAVPLSLGAAWPRAWRGRRLPDRAHCSPRTLALLALLVATVIWGTSFVAAKVALREVPPLTLAAGRFAVAAAVLMPVARCRGVRPARGRTRALLGLTGVALFFVLHNLGLRYTTATDATLVINGGVPVFTAALAALVLGERLRGRAALALVLSVLGVAAASGVQAGTAGSALLGNGLMLASTLSFAVYAVIGRRAAVDGDVLAVVAGSTCDGLLFLLPVAAGELAVGGMAMPSVGALLLILYLGLAASALAYALWGYALRSLQASEAAVLSTLEPLLGIALAAAWLHEGLDAARVVGGGLIIAGVALTATATSPPARVTAPDPVAPPSRALPPRYDDHPLRAA